MAKEFKGKAGTIYIEFSEGDDKPYNVWFEDLVILGVGDTETEALGDAVRHTADMNELARNALAVAQGASGG